MSATPSEYEQYLSYATSFYAWSRHTTPLHCLASKVAPCEKLQRQVKTRLAQEDVILRYAARHHIRLTAAGKRRIRSAIGALQKDGGADALARLGITLAFLRTVLKRQMLVERVERVVAPPWTRQGAAYHVRRYLVPYKAGKTRQRYYEAALTLATDGSPTPPGTIQSDEWLAVFRLSPSERKLFHAAQRGDYVGPITWHNAYVVYHVLGFGTHAYGRPARLMLQTAYFKRWLQTQLTARKGCRQDGKTPAACPTTLP